MVRTTHPHIEVIASDAKGQRFVIWWVYDIGGRKFVTPLLSQLWYGLRSLEGIPYSTLFAYRTACVPSCSAARERLSDFAEIIGGGIVMSRNVSTARQIERRPG